MAGKHVLPVCLCVCVCVCVCVKMAINVTKREQWQQQQQQPRQLWLPPYISSTILNTENNHWRCARHQITHTQRGPTWLLLLLLLHKMSDAAIRGLYLFPTSLALSSPLPSLSLSPFHSVYGLLKAAFLYISRAPHK